MTTLKKGPARRHQWEPGYEYDVSEDGSGERNRTSGTGSAGPSRRLPNRDSRYASWWWAVPAVALVIAIHYAAIAAGSIYAFTDYKGLGSFKFVGLDNFAKIFSGGASMKALINTLIIAFVFLIATNGIGLAFALALNRTLRPGTSCG